MTQDVPVMVDRWFRTIELPLTIEQFHALPTDAAYKYEYFSDQAWLTPRPKHYHALLDLRPREVPESVDAQEPVRIRRIEDRDWGRLPPIFAGAFHRVQPFASLDDTRRLEAARDCLENTRAGGDGPLIARSCFVAVAGDDDALGAILPTLMPDEDLTDYTAGFWKEPPPPDCLERGLGRPHLTWIFVGPWHARSGVGTALLASATNELLALGYRELASTFLLGNDASLLWHWRNGFRLLGYPGSLRQIRQHRRRAEQDPPKPDA